MCQINIRVSVYIGRSNFCRFYIFTIIINFSFLCDFTLTSTEDFSGEVGTIDIDGCTAFVCIFSVCIFFAFLFSHLCQITAAIDVAIDGWSLFR